MLVLPPAQLFNPAGEGDVGTSYNSWAEAANTVLWCFFSLTSVFFSFTCIVWRLVIELGEQRRNTSCMLAWV